MPFDGNSARTLKIVTVSALTGVYKFVNSYEECPESKDTKVLNMYSIFNLQKRHCE